MSGHRNTLICIWLCKHCNAYQLDNCIDSYLLTYQKCFTLNFQKFAVCTMKDAYDFNEC